MATTTKLEKLSALIGGFEQSTWVQDAEERKAYSEEILVRQKIALHILRTLRQADINQKQLAEMLQVSPQQVNKWVKGTENFALSTILKIEQALGIKLIEIVEPKHVLQTSELIKSSRTYEQVPIVISGKFLVKSAQKKMEANKKYNQPGRLA